MLNSVNLSDIRSFVLIARLGNFTKAAEALNVSRSHVSRQLSSLESLLGVTLLVRTTRSLKLTLAGETFFRQCERALSEIDQALIAASDDTEQVRGLIRINCVGGYIGEALIARYIAEFMQEYPEVEVRLDFSSHRVDLIEDEFDVAFRMGELADAGFIARKLMDIEIVTLASPQYLQQFGVPQHPKELSQHRCLTGSVTKWCYRAVSDSEARTEVNITGVLKCKNGQALVLGAKMGSGIIRVPLMYCRDEIENGKLTRILPDWMIPEVAFSAIFHKDSYQPKRLRAFIDYIVDRFQQAH